MSQTKMVDIREIVREAYDRLEPLIQDHVKKMKSTCAPGCAHCCYMLTSISVPEALVIAQSLVQKPDWKALLPKLRKSAQDNCYDGIDNFNYFQKHIACPFLQEDNRCGIYDVRPACCRYHYVVSPPENCDGTSKNGATIGRIDFTKAEDKIWDIARAYSNALHMPRVSVGPISLAVLWALESEVHDTDAQVLEEVRAALDGLPTLEEWVMKYVLS